MNVRLLCPRKSALIIIDIPATREVLQDHWSKQTSCRCPHCGELHSFSVREAYINGVLHATEQDQRMLQNSLVGIADVERQREETASPVDGPRRIKGPRS
jgi:hypothetical protein